MAPKFSERINAAPAQMIQLEGMNEPLQNAIWNFIVESLNPTPIPGIATIAMGFFRFPSHQLPSSSHHEMVEWFWDRYEDLPWYSVYDLLEFLAENSHRLPSRVNRQLFEELANRLLTKELSGYRFIQGTLSAISAPPEIQAIDLAVRAAGQHGLNGVRTHIQTAVKLLGQKPTPDYRNSIKESISAVESAAKSISGVSGGGLDEALKELTKRTEIHKALQLGFCNLYGYSSDQKGIRHALIEESKVGFDEAKFMLVACSAASNFLIAKANEVGLLKK